MCIAAIVGGARHFSATLAARPPSRQAAIAGLIAIALRRRRLRNYLVGALSPLIHRTADQQLRAMHPTKRPWMWREDWSGWRENPHLESPRTARRFKPSLFARDLVRRHVSTFSRYRPPRITAPPAVNDISPIFALDLPIAPASRWLTVGNPSSSPRPAITAKRASRYPPIPAADRRFRCSEISASSHPLVSRAPP